MGSIVTKQGVENSRIRISCRSLSEWIEKRGDSAGARDVGS